MKIFDAHFHIIDPRYPLVPNQGYLPAPFTCADYRRRTEGLGVAGGAVVSGSFQGFDQTYLLGALKALGPGFVGVTQLPPGVGDEELLRLDRSGVRAVRFNLRRCTAGRDHLEDLAQRVYDLVGWHCELYADSRTLAGLYARLVRLPRLVIDHLGLSGEGFPTLRKLVEQGALVKATGFGRLDFDPVPALRDLVRINPEALIFGTDLPSTRAPRPFSKTDIDLVARALGDDSVEKVLSGNGISLYRPGPAPTQ